MNEKMKLKFDDVKNCETIADLNKFIRKYLKQEGLNKEKMKEEREKTHWALFHKWKPPS